MTTGNRCAVGAFCLAAALCVSLRAALLLLILLPLIAVLTLSAVVLLRQWRLSVPPAGAMLLAGGIGGALVSLMLAAIPDYRETLGNTVPVLVLVLLCGCGVASRYMDTPWRSGRVIGSAALLLLIGSVREMLSTGCLMGLPLPVTPLGESFGQTSAGSAGVGGVLVAAVILWLCRRRGTIPSARLSVPESAAIGLVTSVVCGGCLLWERWLPAVGGHGRWGVALLLTAVLGMILGAAFPQTDFLGGYTRVILPVTAVLLLPRHPHWLMVPAAGVGVFGVTVIGTAVFKRLERSRVAFGPSALLTAGALTMAAISAI